jgi:hypothetical protein
MRGKHHDWFPPRLRSKDRDSVTEPYLRAGHTIQVRCPFGLLVACAEHGTCVAYPGMGYLHSGLELEKQGAMLQEAL